ncbi:5'-deoxynucleotidase [Flocculibacter collagenilyticus]|uniref:5'-deoxynucleotidase n=1 Tax=Flocculibacter collagenilyticus TaxID=2744479 RepID=UPI0018F550DA|nr:5'-deoxynucleotidase [Flocculibacter collagenilyticus]
MKQSHFFAHLSRLRLIKRWPLMRNVIDENVQEHSHQVATVAHALALISNRLFNGNVNPDRISTLGLYHDVSEVITGDLPTPVKYYNAEIAKEYKKIEKAAEQRLLQMLPEELKNDFVDLIDDETFSKEEKLIVKAADTLCAYIKTLEELTAGNHEFEVAKKRLENILRNYDSPEVNYFIDVFIPSFSLTLDEIS